MNLPRSDGWQRGAWRPWLHPVFPGPTFKHTAALLCPGCGRAFTLGGVHAIDANGVVSPSVVCPYPPCVFHVFVRLEEWEPACH